MLLDDFGFNNMVQVPTMGNFGGIVFLWDDTQLEVDEILTANQEIHAMIKVCNSTTPWMFSCIYTSVYRGKRRLLWENLKHIKNNYQGKWLIDGDFNDVMNNDQKNGGRPIYKNHTKDF